MHSKVFSDWLPSYIKATRPVLDIFKMAEYFPDRPRIFLFTKTYRLALGPTPPPVQCVLGFLDGINGRSVKLTTHVRLVPRLSIEGVILLLPLHSFFAWTRTLLYIFSPTRDTIVTVSTPKTRTKPNCNEQTYVSTLFYLTTVSSHFPSTRLTYCNEQRVSWMWWRVFASRKSFPASNLNTVK